MRKNNGLTGLRVAVTGGTSGLGLALVRQFYAHGANVAFVARTPSSVQRTARELGVHGIVGDVGRKEDIYPIALQITGGARRPRRPDQQRLEPRARAAHAHSPTPNARRWRRRSTVNVLGPFRLTKALLGALAASAREGRGGGRAQHLERRGSQRLRRLGRLRREQGRAPASDRDLERGDGGRRRALPVARSRATWTRRSTRSPCPMPTRRRSSGRSNRPPS